MSAWTASAWDLTEDPDRCQVPALEVTGPSRTIALWNLRDRLEGDARRAVLDALQRGSDWARFRSAFVTVEEQS